MKWNEYKQNNPDPLNHSKPFSLMWWVTMKREYGNLQVLSINFGEYETLLKYCELEKYCDYRIKQAEGVWD